MWITGSYMIQVSQTNLRYETFSLHWNGSTWSDVAMPLVSGSDTLLAYEFSSMDAISPTNVWAVGGSGDNVIGIGHAERIAPRRRVRVVIARALPWFAVTEPVGLGRGRCDPAGARGAG